MYSLNTTQSKPNTHQFFGTTSERVDLQVISETSCRPEIGPGKYDFYERPKTTTSAAFLSKKD